LVNIRELSDDELVALVDAKYDVERSASASSAREIAEANQVLEDCEQKWAQVSDRLVALTSLEIPRWRRADARHRDEEVRARRVELGSAHQHVVAAARKLHRLEESATDPARLAAASERAIAEADAALDEQRRRQRNAKAAASAAARRTRSAAEKVRK
jgi:hypothetical protein